VSDGRVVIVTTRYGEFVEEDYILALRLARSLGPAHNGRVEIKNKDGVVFVFTKKDDKLLQLPTH
jgi:hypothetical protein